MVGDLFTNWGVWDESAEQELQLFEVEFFCYSNPQFGADKRVLEFTDVAATFLHSYGNALMGCPCGCRSSSFSLTSLRTKGLRGCFVQSRMHHNPHFLHPANLGLLLGMPHFINYGTSIRAGLALLGQIASPLQALWIYAHLQLNVRLSAPQPLEWLRQYQHDLLRQVQVVFHCSCHIPQLISLQDESGDTLVIHSPTATTVAQLLQAQRIVLEWNQAGGILFDGRQLSLNEFVGNLRGPYQFQVQHGSKTRQATPELIVIGITHQGSFTL